MKPFRVYILFLCCGYLITGLVFPSCKKRIQTSQVFVDTTEKALMEAKDIDVFFSDSGKVQARLVSPHANRFVGNNPYMEFPDGFHVDFYDSAMRIQSTITADYGKRIDNARTMEARGNVVVRNEMENKQLNTEILTWNENRHSIYTEAPVKITTPDKILFGEGLTSNESFTEYTLFKVKGEMSVQKDSL